MRENETMQGIINDVCNTPNFNIPDFINACYNIFNIDELIGLEEMILLKGFRIFPGVVDTEDLASRIKSVLGKKEVEDLVAWLQDEENN